MEDNPTVEETRKQANRIAAEDRATQQRHHAQVHREHRALWADHFQRMSSNHAKLAEEYRERAETLMTGGDAA